ncbi:(2Fe-2S)-binding protein [Szabonella alba]|uniref:(2Fe-2S)-binding protein n=1 Tax=Szabonella alba TaxID=2804194 RepID=A0A8K0VBH5_9RHOB|nr:(2Fe-2S)-binding protein [Szabonella alba]MBL4917916.1 (2Fe-2S)-binding protein [Szabonella alba]
MSFTRTPTAARSVQFSFDGMPVQAREGDSVAAALLAAGIDRFRTTPKQGKPRLPYCMMGICFDCLLEIDGEANRQGCMVEVRDGMQVRRQDQSREVRL